MVASRIMLEALSFETYLRLKSLPEGVSPNSFTIVMSKNLEDSWFAQMEMRPMKMTESRRRAISELVVGDWGGKRG